jgi:hypothetical protein
VDYISAAAVKHRRPMGWLSNVSCVCLRIMYFVSLYHLFCICRLVVLRVVLHEWRLEYCIVFNYDVGRLIRIFLLLCHLKGLHALTAGSGPFERYGMGFAATPDGMLYVFGGLDNSGTERGRCGGDWAAWGWLRWTQSCGVHALHRCCSRSLLRRGRRRGGRRRARVRVCLRRASGPHMCYSIEGRPWAGMRWEERRSAPRQVLTMCVCTCR